MLKKARVGVQRGRTEDMETVPLLITESNAENYMDSLQGFLVLTSFKMSPAQQPGWLVDEQDSKRHSPAFAVVYGGYMVGLGAEWFRSDWTDQDWWCGKLAQTFNSGTQMGWFSLTGRAHDPNDHCGAMGVADLLVDDQYTPLVDYLRRLADVRLLSLDYVLYGSLARPPVLDPVPRVMISRAKTTHMPLQQYVLTLTLTLTPTLTLTLTLTLILTRTGTTA